MDHRASERSDVGAGINAENAGDLGRNPAAMITAHSFVAASFPARTMADQVMATL
jgi:hypothetical protein